jgi:apolipoprotein N-acyltransferase
LHSGRRLPKLRALNSSRATQLASHPLAWAVVAGLALALAFPRFHLAGLAWLAPGLMVLAGTLDVRHSFRTGYVAGLLAHLVALHWLLFIPVKWFPLLGWLALAGYLAFFTAAWVWVCVRLRPVEDAFPGRFLWPLGGAAAWVALELAQARLLTGFPWNQLGTSQYRQLPLLQIASFTGVYGVSFLLVWASLALLNAALALRREPRARGWRLDLLPPALAVALVLAWGMFQLVRPAAPARELTLALVQPSIPQTLIWDADENTNRFRKLLELSRLALAAKPDLLLWPEAAVPGLLRYDEETHAAVTALARDHGVALIVGADDAEPKDGDPQRREAVYFNSAFLIARNGEIRARYDKQRLVAFGEYVPLANWLPLLKCFTPITGGFTPGRRAVPFALEEPRVRTAVLICFEDLFATLARRCVDPETDFLVNLTNNGWFGESAAQWQHAAGAVFRAVENGLPLVRCTNNGLTCWVDAAGRLHAAWSDDARGIYGAGIQLARVPALAPGQRRALTFYTRHGDVFGWSCVALTAALAGRGWRRARVISRAPARNGEAWAG